MRLLAWLCFNYWGGYTVGFLAGVAIAWVTLA